MHATRKHNTNPPLDRTSKSFGDDCSDRVTNSNHALYCFCYCCCCRCHYYQSPRLTFTWWGCNGLCLLHELTELAHSFFFCSCVCFCLYCPFNCISFHKSSRSSPVSHSVLLVLSLPEWSFQLYMSLGKSPSALMSSLVVD